MNKILITTEESKAIFSFIDGKIVKSGGATMYDLLYFLKDTRLLKQIIEARANWDTAIWSCTRSFGITFRKIFEVDTWNDDHIMYAKELAINEFKAGNQVYFGSFEAFWLNEPWLNSFKLFLVKNGFILSEPFLNSREFTRAFDSWYCGFTKDRSIEDQMKAIKMWGYDVIENTGSISLIELAFVFGKRGWYKNFDRFFRARNVCIWFRGDLNTFSMDVDRWLDWYLK